MSREEKRASGKQWNRSGSGKKITGPNRTRTSKKFRRKQRNAKVDWQEPIDNSVEAQDETYNVPNERLQRYVLGEDVDSATSVLELEPRSLSEGWLTKLLGEIRGESESMPLQVCTDTMRLTVASASDIGCYREKNEDALYVDEKLGLFIVCDGMGGNVAVEIASQKAIEFTVDFLVQARSRRILPEAADRDFREVWSDLMVEALEHCCEKVFQFAQSNPELEGMATTITALMIVDGFAFVGHIGDTQLYLCHGDVAKQLTIDHNLLNDMLRSQPNLFESSDDPESFLRFQHVLTRCVGRTQIETEPDSFSFPLMEDDILLLCSDGLSKYFVDESELSQLLNSDEPSGVVRSLINVAKNRGGSDNISAILVRVSRNNASLVCSPTADTVESDR